MTTNELRNAGYLVVSLHGRILIRKREGGPIRSQPNDKGRWMERETHWEDDSSPESIDHVNRVAACCYCGHGCRCCDFCAGVRSPVS